MFVHCYTVLNMNSAVIVYLQGLLPEERKSMYSICCCGFVSTMSSTARKLVIVIKIIINKLDSVFFTTEKFSYICGCSEREPVTVHGIRVPGVHDDICQF